jgi:hypothetical protein
MFCSCGVQLDRHLKYLWLLGILIIQLACFSSSGCAQEYHSESMPGSRWRMDSIEFPIYPPIFLVIGAQGKVKVNCSFSIDRSVHNCRGTDSDPVNPFSKFIIPKVENWKLKYTPLPSDIDKKTPSKVEFNFNFIIAGTCEKARECSTQYVIPDTLNWIVIGYKTAGVGY